MIQNPRIENKSEDLDMFKFTLRDVNVSVANGLRRTILSDIPTVVFRTAPYEESKATIITNTTRLNNEILKQRLSCIPIHITDLEMPLQNYLVEVNVENITNTIMYVTTEDFRIKNLITGEYLLKKDQIAIFPPSKITGYYIDFARLRPKISDELPGEKLHFTCEFSIGTAKEDGMFNAVSTCSYGFTQDDAFIEDALRKKQQEWKDAGFSKDEIEFNSKDFMLLDAQRIVKKDSFDFVVQTVGVFENQDICHKACDILIEKLDNLNTLLETDDVSILPSDNTMKNSYDVTLVNEDYTIGKVLEYYLHAKFFEGVKTLSFCGFKKMHPHDSDSIIRIAYREEVEKTNVVQNLKECIADAIAVYKIIKELI
jgi:DNA-directed RNA polymerase subunit L/phenylpyruvate tautomerase PptA (4-oxalocrotonate tautomerase family)